MKTYERATFALEEFGHWEGVHIPSEKWNGFACPLFTLDTCKSIAELVNALPANDEVIEVTNEKVISIYLGNGEREVEEVLPVFVDGVAMFPLGAGGWVWDVVTFTPCLECGVVTDGRTYEFCVVCDELDLSGEVK